MNISVSNFVIAIPEIYLALVTLVLFITGLVMNNTDPSNKVLFFNRMYYISIISIILTLFLVYVIGDRYVETFNSLFFISPNVYIFKLVLIIMVIFIAILSRRYLIYTGIIGYEYIIFFMLLLLGNMLMISSNDFIVFYLSFELVAITTYIMIFMDRNNSTASDSGIKYFLLGALGTGFMLYGISLIYGFTGYTNFMDIKQVLTSSHNNLLVIFGLVMIIVGLSFKLSLVPFHMWTADVYKGSSISMVLLFSTVLKVGVLFILIRILLEPFGGLEAYWRDIIFILVLLSGVVGFVGIVYQTNFKSFIAYSSIASSGFVLLTALIGNELSVKYMIIYVVSYYFSLIGFIGVLMLLKYHGREVNSIYDLQGFAIKHPYLALSMSIFTLSLAGIPITSGFFGKFWLLLGVLGESLYVLPIIMILLSVVPMYFYFKLIKMMYFDRYEESEVQSLSQSLQLHLDIKGALFLLLLFTIAFVFLVNPLDIFLNSVIILF